MLVAAVLIVRFRILVVSAFVMRVLLPLIAPAVGLRVFAPTIIRPVRAAMLGFD